MVSLIWGQLSNLFLIILEKNDPKVTPFGCLLNTFFIGNCLSLPPPSSPPATQNSITILVKVPACKAGSDMFCILQKLFSHIDVWHRSKGAGLRRLPPEFSIWDENLADAKLVIATLHWLAWLLVIVPLNKSTLLFWHFHQCTFKCPILRGLIFLSHTHDRRNWSRHVLSAHHSRLDNENRKLYECFNQYLQKVAVIPHPLLPPLSLLTLFLVFLSFFLSIFSFLFASYCYH